MKTEDHGKFAPNLRGFTSRIILSSLNFHGGDAILGNSYFIIKCRLFNKGRVKKTKSWFEEKEWNNHAKD